MGAPVVHWEINGKDAKRLHEFYANLFGWKIKADNPINYGLVDTGVKLGANGGIGQSAPENPAPSVTFYVQVDDLQAHLDKAASLGGRTVLPVTEIPNMVTMALFADPEGNTIGLVKSMEPPRKRRASARRKKRPARRARRQRR